MSRQFKFLLIFLIILGASAIVILQASFASAVQSPTSNYFPDGERIIYLASDPQSADTDLPVSMQELQQKGITIVYDARQLKQLVETNNVDAIIIHRSRASDVADLGLPVLYQQGIVIAGIDIKIHELAALVGDELLLNEPAWSDGWQQSPFFSIVAFKPHGTVEEQRMLQQDGFISGKAARHSDNMLSIEGVDHFLNYVRGDIEFMKALP